MSSQNNTINPTHTTTSNQSNQSAIQKPYILPASVPLTLTSKSLLKCRSQPIFFTYQSIKQNKTLSALKESQGKVRYIQKKSKPQNSNLFKIKNATFANINKKYFKIFKQIYESSKEAKEQIQQQIFNSNDFNDFISIREHDLNWLRQNPIFVKYNSIKPINITKLFLKNLIHFQSKKKWDLQIHFKEQFILKHIQHLQFSKLRSILVQNTPILSIQPFMFMHLPLLKSIYLSFLCTTSIKPLAHCKLDRLNYIKIAFIFQYHQNRIFQTKKSIDISYLSRTKMQNSQKISCKYTRSSLIIMNLLLLTKVQWKKFDYPLNNQYITNINTYQLNHQQLQSLGRRSRSRQYRNIKNNFQEGDQDDDSLIGDDLDFQYDEQPNEPDLLYQMIRNNRPELIQGVNYCYKVLSQPYKNQSQSEDQQCTGNENDIQQNENDKMTMNISK